MSEIPEPWPCQVLFVERSDSVVVLDLVAMAPCPFEGPDMPSGMPFTIRLRCDEESSFELIDEWVRHGRLVTIREVHLYDQRWLYVSEHGRYLVMQLTGPRR